VSERVVIGARPGTGRKAYHTRECQYVQAMDSPQRHDRATAEAWYDLQECARCRELRAREQIVP